MTPKQARRERAEGETKMQSTKSDFRDVKHRPRRSMSKRAEREYRRQIKKGAGR